MKKRTIACVVLWSSLVAAQPKPKEAAPGIDLAALAENMVGRAANIKEGEVVQIAGPPTDMALLEELAVAVRKRGAFPLITVFSENLQKKMIATVPAKYDTQMPAHMIGVANLVNARIVIPWSRDASIDAPLGPVRQAAISKAALPVAAAMRKRKVRLVEFDGALVPSPSRAKELGVSETELSKVFWGGIAGDFSVVEKKANVLRDVLAGGQELRITHPNGTNLKIKIKGRKLLTSDGVTTDAEIKEGGPSANVYLPAGEVYLTPVPGSAEGKLVDDRLLYEGKWIEGVAIEVKAGKITSITAKSGWDVLKARYDVAGPGKNELGIIDFGVNPFVKPSDKIETYMAAGMISIVTGNNGWAGGTNTEPFGLAFQMSGTTVTLDGKPLIENGQLK